MLSILQVLERSNVFKIDVSQAVRILLLRWVVLTVANSSCRELFELHNILCQSSGLVGENVMDHA